MSQAECRWGDNGLEYDQNEPRQTLVDWLEQAGGCLLFDFCTKGILAEAVRHTQYWRLIDHEGRMPGLAGYWPSRSVTFIDNHDTGKGQDPVWALLQASAANGARLMQPWVLGHVGCRS